MAKKTVKISEKLSDKYTNMYSDATGKEAFDLRQEWDGRQLYHPTHEYVAWLIIRLEESTKPSKTYSDVLIAGESSNGLKPTKTVKKRMEKANAEFLDRHPALKESLTKKKAV